MRAALLAFFLSALVPAFAQSPQIPSFWDARERIERPQIELPRLRFLTTVDFPPFSSLDANNQLIGFHVDLARDICRQLSLDAVCQIQALPWDELVPALENGDGEAIIAGLAPTAELREQLSFTRPYLKFPARFVAARSAGLPEPLHRSIRGKRVGVVSGSAHEALLRAHFPDAVVVPFSRADWMLRDLKAGRIDAAFSDGMRIANWLAGDEPDDCCAFVGGPYLAPEYLGQGLTIAVTRDNADLATAFDSALREIDASGRFAELYLRYFPVSFF
ncbi:transporter substrate-binding domain-containing protein [Aliihoeflea sp. 40Bstr573]|uniref:transporter substrate-binding domain-containing protein n=1 Tax=Aliihoeflea sp. 40Bstr573 TaxID=2696467 RepID=UPI0020947600|nr:transporter substrate-binding domain-containing protein [Aliihoeflea sp. 40Bstr573]MCO6388333.1 transporter substrate-binding domain-containing protein [Aliihoeflea sp. 40Bstr573]